MLDLSNQLHYLHEPFNPSCKHEFLFSRIHFDRYMQYITEDMDDYYQYYIPIKRLIESDYSFLSSTHYCRSFRDYCRLLKHQKHFIKALHLRKPLLIKDPIAVMSAGWLYRTFNLNVLVMIRHPAAFVASMKRLNWSFDPNNWALSQPLLMRDFLSPFESELKYIVNKNPDVIFRLSILWKIIYFVVLKYQETFKSWLYVKYETLAEDPLLHFNEIYHVLGLTFSPDVKNKITEYTNEKNPPTSGTNKHTVYIDSKRSKRYWQQYLSSNEIQTIKNIVTDVSTCFYQDEDWEIG